MPELIVANASLMTWSGEAGKLARSGELAAMPWAEFWPLYRKVREEGLAASFEERATAAAAAGFAGMTIHFPSYPFSSPQPSHAALMERVGLTASCAESLGAMADWFAGTSEKQPAIEADEQRGFAFAETFKAAVLNIYADPHTPEHPPFEVLVQRFGALCDRAARRGLTVRIENCGGGLIPDPITAWRVVEAAGRDNSGIAIDLFSFFRAGCTLETLNGIPPERILAVQLSDGDQESDMPLGEELYRRRLCPGEGVFDIAGIVRAIEDMGAQPVYEVEVFSDAQRGRPVQEAAERAFAGGIQVLHEAGID
jgi:sugar phosphate isomerase/epimerase